MHGQQNVKTYKNISSAYPAFSSTDYLYCLIILNALFAMAQQPLVDQGRLIFEASH